MIHVHNTFIETHRKKRVSIQSMQQDKNKMSNSVSQTKMMAEPKVVSTQTTISTTASKTAEVRPQPVQAPTPDHKAYVTEMRKELSEASTATPTWSPSHNGHFLVSIEIFVSSHG